MDGHGNMKRFQINYNRLRLVCAMATCLAIGCASLAHSFSFDFELPSSEGMNREKNERDNQNRDAYERTRSGEGSERDHQRAAEYEREHITVRSHD